MRFLEEQGRKFFLLYLRPIINGTGNYYIEAQTRDAGRTDVIVDYAGEQFVIEMKIWRGNEYHERGEEQITGYLEYFHLEKGYLLSFNFNKKKKPGMNTIMVNKKGDRGGGRLTAAPIELPVSEKGSVLYIRCDEQGWLGRSCWETIRIPPPAWRAGFWESGTVCRESRTGGCPCCGSGRRRRRC